MPVAHRSLDALRVLLAAAMLCAGLAPAAAEERIHAFTSTIEVEPSGALVVTEDIEVEAEGRAIRRGIYRDFPLRFEDAEGASRKVGFELLSVRRDGAAEPHSLRPGGDGVRIYIGDPDRFVDPGRHSYELVYETTRQIRFFDDHDELYWNVTGQDWAFPIDRATARVELPAGVRAGEWTAYTGPYGARGQDWTARTEDAGRVVVFTTTAPLAPGEGFTIVVSLPKGAVAPPTPADEARYFLLDHKNELLAAGGFALVLVYFVWAWRRVGRDPAPGTIIPLFEAPEGVSPALADYIHHKGFSGGGWRALSAACLNLAVNGHLELDDVKSRLTLRPTGHSQGRGRLPGGEAAVLDTLNGAPLTLEKAEGPRVKKLADRFRKAIERENRNRFFKANIAYWVPGVVASVLALVALLAFGDLTAADIGFLMPVVVTVGMLSYFALKFARSVSRSRGIGRAMKVLFGLAVAGIVLTATGAEVAQDLLASDGTPVLMVAVVALVVVNVLFFVLLGAPTALGRDMMDRLEGLRLYLSVAERERMNMAGAPQMSPSRFETLLPYAVALNVERPWSEAFQTWLASSAVAAAGAAAYAPAWYHGRAFEPDRFGRSMEDTVGAMERAFSSSVPTPKSSSSGFGGGGGAGGGGGGGGGGGW